MKHEMPYGLRIKIINAALKAHMDEQAAKMDLTSVQLRVLSEIDLMESSGIEEINQKDLEKMEKVSHPAMTGIIQRLEKKGYVVCVPSSVDKRYKKITCAKEVCGIYKKLEKWDNQAFCDLCCGLTDEQIKELLCLLDVMLNNAMKD